MPGGTLEFGTAAELAEGLGRKLGEPHVARPEWSRFAPELTYGRHAMPPPPRARRAAVLVLLYASAGQWHLPLMERTTDNTVHSGQVCFPGGALESDESPEVAAVRELEEELGVPGRALRLCGRLTSMYIYASNYLVTPCVAVAVERPQFQANPQEVAHVLEFPLSVLSDAACIGRHEIRRRGVLFEAPHIEFLGRRIWGATSMMLAELAARWP
jgi:8-oxo-dGTP pyrophosphatase MutT (NUDIX family)